MEVVRIQTQRYATTLIAICVIMVACGCQSDVTKNPTRWTDFAVGRVYELEKPVFILAGGLMTWRGQEPLDSEGKLIPGTKLLIKQAVVFRSPEIGTYTQVYAEVLDGEKKGRTVSVTHISEWLQSGYTKRDPEMLKLVE